MAAFGYYTNATQYVMRSHELNENYLFLLQESLAPLRFYLSCRVCNKILKDPATPDHTACKHTVCSKCIGGKMRLKPSCGWCKNYENFVENKSLAVLIKCYKKLCQYVVSSSDYRKQLEFINKCSNSSAETAKDKVAALLKEGCEVESLTLETDAAKPVSSSSVLKSGDNLAASTANKASSPASSTSGAKGDLKLKLIIPSGGKRRRWYATVPTQASKASKKKSNLTTSKSQQQTGEVSLGESVTSSPTKTTENIESEVSTEGGLDSSLQHAMGDGILMKKEKKMDGSKSDRKRCGCGSNSQTLPGKLTCYGQRCPCYSSRIPCLGCKCKGCRNPNKIVRIEQASEDTDGDEINVE